MHWSKEVKNQVIGMQIAGTNLPSISRQLGIPERTVRKWIRRFMDAGNVDRLPGSGRNRKTTNRSDRQLVRWAKSVWHRKSTASALLRMWDEPVSKQSVLRRLWQQGLHARRPLRRPLLSRLNREQRMTWAMNHNIWPDATWRRVVWSDESRFLLHPCDGRLRVWRQRGQRFLEGFSEDAIAYGGGSVHVWGAIWSGGKSSLFFHDRNVNAAVYRDVLEFFLEENGAQLGDPQMVLSG